MGRRWNQTEALFRKNLTFQKRNPRSNAWIILFPAILFALFSGYRYYQKKHTGDPYPAKPASEIPPLLEIPSNEVRAVKTAHSSFDDLPDASCRKTASCPATSLITGKNRTLAQSLAGIMYPNSSTLTSANVIDIADDVWGTDDIYQFFGLGGFTYIPSTVYMYHVESYCSSNSTSSLPTKIGNTDVTINARCLQGLNLWRENNLEINKELFEGYPNGNPDGEINEIVAAYDLLYSSSTRFNAHVWYNSTYGSQSAHVHRVLSMVWNAYLQFLRGPSLQMKLEYTGEMGIPEHGEDYDWASELAAIFFTWVFLQLFPVTLSSLVYEKQQKLQIMMKMHGLGDGPYWVIMYMYFFIIGLVYVLFLVGFGSLSGLPFFRLNSFAVQMLFYVIHMNLLIPSAFLLSSFFSNVKTATVFSYMMILATWLIGATLFDSLIEDTSFPRAYLILLELFPGFSLYRGLYEFRTYSVNASLMGTYGMRWHVLSDSASGIREVIIIMSAEWILLLIPAYYLSKVFALASGFPRLRLCFSQKSQKSSISLKNLGSQDQHSSVVIQSDKQDVDQEREKVRELLAQPQPTYPILSDNLKKIYPPKNGSPEKHAVRGLSIAIARGECFGLLGPNGAGKTSFLNMMTGLTKPSSGTAYIGALNLRKQMDKIYESMGVCPQDNLLWECLTGREHLNFYGRLRNLRGRALSQAVEDSLRSVNLLQDGDKQAGKYSGGMKRRLSVAISLIGNPKVVYLDEPGTGLDPASKDMLWGVVEKAKQDRAIILTTHSMEEAERLCDRIGIFVDGNLQCIGSPDELKARYGGTYIFTMTTSPENEMEVEALARGISANAKRVYSINGTQKFELPKEEVRFSEVFRAVTDARKRFDIQAWEISETTLEDVFLKVASEAQISSV